MTILKPHWGDLFVATRNKACRAPEERPFRNNKLADFTGRPDGA